MSGNDNTCKQVRYFHYRCQIPIVHCIIQLRRCSNVLQQAWMSSAPAELACSSDSDSSWLFWIYSRWSYIGDLYQGYRKVINLSSTRMWPAYWIIQASVCIFHSTLLHSKEQETTQWSLDDTITYCLVLVSLSSSSPCSGTAQPSEDTWSFGTFLSHVRGEEHFLRMLLTHIVSSFWHITWFMPAHHIRVTM